MSQQQAQLESPPEVWVPLEQYLENPRVAHARSAISAYGVDGFVALYDVPSVNGLVADRADAVEDIIDQRRREDEAGAAMEGDRFE